MRPNLEKGLEAVENKGTPQKVTSRQVLEIELGNGEGCRAIVAVHKGQL